MIDYPEIAEGALEAIKEAGRVIVIKRYSSAYDGATATDVMTLTHEGDFTVAVLPAKKANALAGFGIGFDNAYAEALRKGKVRALLIAASEAPFEPAEGDRAEFDNGLWNFLGCTPISPAGVPVVYKAEVVWEAPAS